MVYAHRVNRVTFSGTMFGGAEQWSTGFWLGQEGSDAQDPTDAMATYLLDAWRVFFNKGDTSISSQYSTTQCKVAQFLDTGRTDLTKVHYAFPTTALVGGNASETLPPQCSIVATLLSDRPRGLASKGRMYLPGIATAVGINGKMSTIRRDTIALNLRAFFNTVRAGTDFTDRPILVAKGIGPLPALTAQNDYIQTIRIGDVIDTQRRRRNQLVESYKTEILI
jgi:hypothetical protein